MTKIDVIIPVFNGEHYVAASIDSVLRQTLSPQRIIVVDDGSTDGTEAAVLALSERSSIEIVYLKKVNGGPNSARNMGLRKATSEFVAFLDADDCWYPEKLARQAEKFRQGPPGLGVVYCAYELIGENGKPLGVPSMPIDKRLKGDIFRRLLLANTVMGSASAVLIRRACFGVVGEFDEGLRIGEDWDMWLRLAEKFAFEFVDEELVMIRKHPASAQSNEEYAFRHELAFYDKWARLLPWCRVPWRWAVTISAKVIRRFPRRDFFDFIPRGLSRAARCKIFCWTLGFYRPCLLLVAIALTAVRILRDLSGAASASVIILSWRRGNVTKRSVNHV